MKRQNLKTSQAELSQAKEIASLLVESITNNCYPDHGNDQITIENWVANKTPESVQSWLENEHNQSIVVQDHDDTIVGFAILTHSYEILVNYVKPKYTGLGVGGELMTKLEKLAEANGSNLLQTDSTVSAVGFYVAKGFILNKTKAHQAVNEGIPLYKYIVS